MLPELALVPELEPEPELELGWLTSLVLCLVTATALPAVTLGRTHWVGCLGRTRTIERL